MYNTSVSPQEITEIAMKITKGDNEPFAGIVDEYKGFVFNFASQMSGSRELAQDLTQEIFLRVFSQLSKYKPDFPFKSWLGRVAYTTTLNYLRKKRETIAIESLAQESPFEVKDDTKLPEDVLLEKVTKESVTKAIASLKPDLRAVVVLCGIQGIEISQAAAMLDIPEGTVKSRFSRAKEDMKQAIMRTFTAKGV
ncbi:MAG: RNA polymerase sigma factor [Caldiserica bacterium]|nr:RNA polymerase sigma factor [Caldisericota bacterium]